MLNQLIQKCSECAPLDIPYFLEISLWQYFISMPCLVRRQFEGGVCSDRLTCSFDDQHCSPFVHTNIACGHTYIVVNPLSCGEISGRAVLIGMIFLKVQRHFEGGDNSTCGDILRKYGTYSMCNQARELANGLKDISLLITTCTCKTSIIVIFVSHTCAYTLYVANRKATI